MLLNVLWRSDYVYSMVGTNGPKSSCLHYPCTATCVGMVCRIFRCLVGSHRYMHSRFHVMVFGKWSRFSSVLGLLFVANRGSLFRFWEWYHHMESKYINRSIALDHFQSWYLHQSRSIHQSRAIKTNKSICRPIAQCLSSCCRASSCYINQTSISSWAYTMYNQVNYWQHCHRGIDDDVEVAILILALSQKDETGFAKFINQSI